MTWKVLFQKYDENDGYFSDSFNIINTKYQWLSVFLKTSRYFCSILLHIIFKFMTRNHNKLNKISF